MNNILQVSKLEPRITKEFKKLNVAAYARVSTKKELQETSFELQVAAYYDLIASNPLWNFVGIFADHGKSGTSTTNRKEFNNMIELAKLGEIDVIITKSVSRFTRDVVDGLTVIQDLRNIGIEIYFEKENISSLDSVFDMFLTIHTSVAEEESKQISSNVLWNYKNKMKNGLSTTSRLYGFKIINGEYFIIQKEAYAVKLIYELYLNGYKYIEIIEALEKQGYKTRNGNGKFTISSLKGILRNEKYAGDMLLQKTTVTKIGTRESVRNTTKDKYYVYDNHKPIIDKNTFNKVQLLINERNNKFNPSKSKRKSMKYSNYVYSLISRKFYKSKINHRNKSYQVELLEALDNNGKRVLEAENIYYRQIDDLLDAAANLLIAKQASFKKDVEFALQKKIEASKIDLLIESNTYSINELKAKRAEITRLSLNDSLTKDILIKIDDELKELNFKYSKLMFDKVMKYNYNKNYGIIRKNIKQSITDENFDLKEIFKLVIAVDRENLILPLHLSNRNLDDIDLDTEASSKPVYTGTFNFKQTRLNLVVNWSIIII